MREIGGYFGLELPRGDKFMHSDGVLLDSGRHAFEFILKHLSGPLSAIWLPAYTCGSILQPLIRVNLDIKYYDVDICFEIKQLPELSDGEYIVVNNYFGLKDGYVGYLESVYGDRMIVDATQSWFFSRRQDCMTFYSPRKFFGVPDGGISYPFMKFKTGLKTDISFERMSHLLKRIDTGADSGYEDFKKNGETFSNSEIKGMSRITRRILASIDYEAVKDIRLRNFRYLHSLLEDSNEMCVDEVCSGVCPMIYPYMSNKNGLRRYLIDNKIYVARYWPELVRPGERESIGQLISETLLPLPIDQRYDREDMERIASCIYRFNNSK